MSDFDKTLNEFKEELFNEQCVKEYFYYKNLVDKDESIKKLDEEVRFHQKEMWKNKDNNELYFRDFLNEHPQIAKEYETLKLGLWKKYEHNRDAYTDAKTGFICKWTAEARKLYGDRYWQLW